MSARSVAKRRMWPTWLLAACVLVVGLAAVLSAAERGADRPVGGNALSAAGLGFRVQAEPGGVVLRRTRDVLAFDRALPGIYTGAAAPVLDISFGADAKPEAGKKSWVHQAIVYHTAAGETTVTVNRLSPAVLVDHPGSEVVLAVPQAGAPIRYLATVEGGKVVTRAAADLAESGISTHLDEPWILAWFGADTVICGHSGMYDVDSAAGVSKERLTSGAQDRVDVPVLVRLEHRPAAIKRRGGTIVLQFPASAGKVAIMPLFGRRVWLPPETEGWKSGLPEEVTAQCRLWSRVLRDYPVTVTESFSVDAARDVLAIGEAFEWASFEDDWKTPPVKAAPVSPMLAMALGGGVPVTFHAGEKEIVPADYRLMDSFGKAMGVEGADAYEYRIAGLGRSLLSERSSRRPAAPVAKPLREQLERHVAEMVDAGHLRPLFYAHGGISSDWYANWYWLGTPETAGALARAYPYLSPTLQARVRAYMAAEWKDYPPLRLDDAYYKAGTPREPYDIPWNTIRIGVSRTRDEAYRQRNFFLDLYRIDACQETIGEVPDLAALRGPASRMAADLASRMDWAILGPVRLRQLRSLQETRFMTLQGSAAYNSWLGGAIGMVRLARREGWKDEENLGWCLAGQLAMARIGQARYVAEMHRMGLARGKAEEDYRAVSHIDETCTIVRWGPITTITHEDQEFPPFIDLVPEVGRLLAAHARAECATYLGYLDNSVPYWYLSEAPKQSATEHRTCPLWHQSGNVAAQAWVRGKTGDEFRRYVDATRFKGDLFYIQNLVTAIEEYGE